MSPSRSHVEEGPNFSTGESAAAAGASEVRPHSRATDYVTLVKPRLNFLVLLTTATAYSLGSRPTATLIDLTHTLLGTFLVAGGASALNQAWESRTDRLMRRTRQRPVADMRMTISHATGFGVVLVALGSIELALFVNVLSSAIALATAASYVFFYTPLKVQDVAFDDRRRPAGRIARGDRMGCCHQHALDRSLGPVRHRLHVADAALPGDRVDVSR